MDNSRPSPGAFDVARDSSLANVERGQQVTLKSSCGRRNKTGRGELPGSGAQERIPHTHRSDEIGGSIPIIPAFATALPRVATSSLARICDTWLLTVRRLRKRLPAISSSVSPSAANLRMSSSRPDNVSEGAGRVVGVTTGD